MREETRNWITKAERDLGTAVFAMGSVDGPLPVTTGLHCQQSARKYLKAYVQEYDVKSLDRQNLSSLLEVCVSIDKSFESLRMDISQLEGYSIASHYPKASDALEFNTDAVATAQRVKEFVVGKLK